MSELKDLILAAQDLPSEVVDVPEWGLKVNVRGLSAKERDEYFMNQTVVRDGQIVGQDRSNATARLLVLCIRDDDGEPVFGPEHVDVLGAKSAAATERLSKVALRLSGIGDGAVEAAGKESAPALNGASPSASPVTSAA
jgi:hypothetical protein